MSSLAFESQLKQYHDKDINLSRQQCRVWPFTGVAGFSNLVLAVRGLEYIYVFSYVTSSLLLTLIHFTIYILICPYFCPHVFKVIYCRFVVGVLLMYSNPFIFLYQRKHVLCSIFSGHKVE